MKIVTCCSGDDELQSCRIEDVQYYAVASQLIFVCFSHKICEIDS